MIGRFPCAQNPIIDYRPSLDAYFTFWTTGEDDGTMSTVLEKPIGMETEERTDIERRYVGEVVSKSSGTARLTV